jgi:hypothetical protein
MATGGVAKDVVGCWLEVEIRWTLKGAAPSYMLAARGVVTCGALTAFTMCICSLCDQHEAWIAHGSVALSSWFTTSFIVALATERLLLAHYTRSYLHKNFARWTGVSVTISLFVTARLPGCLAAIFISAPELCLIWLLNITHWALKFIAMAKGITTKIPIGFLTLATWTLDAQ